MGYSVIGYDEKGSSELKNATIEDASKLSGKFWIDWTNPKRDNLKELEKHFGFHHLTLDDCIHAVQRPKVEEYKDHFFLIAIAVNYRNNSKVEGEQIGFFIGKNYLVTVHKNELPLIENTKKALLENNQLILSRGPRFLMYRILDTIVDEYFTVLDDIEDDISKVENEIVKKPTKVTVQRIFKLRKDLLLLRKIVWPLREVVNLLRSSGLPNISEETMHYYRDLYDHVIQVIDLIETYRELLIGALDTYLSSVSNALNEVMKVLTVITALILVPTWIAAIYGMNFKYMPELQWKFGYPFALLLMLASMIVMWIYFRRRGWA
ncbi:MAG: magnesium/cobalt transporter CorA [Candidatus Altiarchaeota archaeon]